MHAHDYKLNYNFKSWHEIIFYMYNHKLNIMKVFGIILIIVGILMFIFSKITFSNKEKVADVGPLEINKTEHHTVDWPTYAGGIAVIAGIVVLLIDKRKA
jgi:uncharacterized membrane protein YdcZ (DUF606 family)